MKLHVFLASLALSAPAVAQCDPANLAALTPSDSAFGHHVRADGDLLAVSSGDEYQADSGTWLPGGVSLYRRGALGWQGETHVRSLAALGDYSVDSMDLEGDRLAVLWSDNFGEQTLDVFERGFFGWSLAASLPHAGVLGGPSATDLVAIHGDEIVAGTTVYERGFGGWAFAQELPLPPAYQISSVALLSVALEGDWLVVGHASFGVFEGALLFFERAGDQWTFHSDFRAPGAGQFDLLGNSVDLDGSTLVAGAPDYGSPGEVWVFEETGGVWAVTETLLSPLAPGGYEHIGTMLDLEGDRLAVIGTSRVLLHERLDGAWTLTSIFQDDSPFSVSRPTAALAGDEVIVGYSGGAASRAEVHDFRGGTASETCTAGPNSSGAVATLEARGSLRASDDALFLDATGLPATTQGLLVYGPALGRQPLGNGNLCIDPVGGLQRGHEVVVSNAAGRVLVDVDLGVGAFDVSGDDTLHFQLWFRDPAGGGAGFDLSSALSVTFCD